MRGLGIGIAVAGVFFALAWMHQSSQETERLQLEKCVATGGYVYKGWMGWGCNRPDPMKPWEQAPKP